jgi:2-keto-3-deoxy-L-rhamnonate aldolase RhmA
MSIGRPGERTHPEVDAARKKVFETAIRMGVPPRAELFTPDQAREYLDMGVRHFSIGTDLMILHGWWKDNGARLRELIDGR